MSPQSPKSPAQPTTKPAKSMTPARDEVASFQRRKKGSGYAISSGGNSTPIYVVLAVLVLGMFGGAAWGYTQITKLQTELAVTKTELSRTLSNLEAVNEQLELTDQVLNQPGGSVQKKLSLFDSEIRKLWGNYKKQKSQIATNKKRVATATANTKNLSKKVTKATAQSNKADKSHKSTLTDLSRKISSNKQAAGNKTDKLTSDLSSLKKQVGKLPKQQQAANTAPLMKKIQENEEAIVAIDSFRVQTNRALDKLRKTVATLRKQLETQSAVTAGQ